MANATTMRYGDYYFSPVPFMSFSKEHQRTDDQTPVGLLYVVTLNGTVTDLPNQTGITKNISISRGIRNAFLSDGRYFEVKCGGDILFSGCPRIRNIQFDESQDNWVFTIPFTIELEFDVDTSYGEASGLYPPYIESLSEEYSFEFMEDRKHFDIDLSTITDQQPTYYYGQDNNQLYIIRATHSVSAKGKRHFTCSSGTPSGSLDKLAWQQAREAVLPLLGATLDPVSGVMNLPTGTSSIFDHYRTNTVGVYDGTFSVVENWLFMPSAVNSSGEDRATEDFTISVNKSLETDLTVASIEGSIQGLETINYTGVYSITEKAYDAAQNYWNFIQPRVFSRVQYVGEAEANRNYNPIPLTETVGHNPSKGTITYSYEFDDRPCNFITGALTENFSITDNFPTDIFAILPVLGRARGPVLQAINTVSEQTREVAIEAVMPLPTGCSSITDFDLNNPQVNVENLFCEFEAQITGAYEQVFKNVDTQNWNPRTGRYSRNVTWTIQNCSGGTAPNSSFC